MNKLDKPHPDVTKNDVLGGKIVVWQPAIGYRVGIDTVLLASATTPKKDAKILDLGCGVGGISLCLLANFPNVKIDGLEIDDELVRLAKQNAVVNGFGTKFNPLIGTVADPPGQLRPASFDMIVTNPPHFEAGKISESPLAKKRTANVEGDATFEVWIECAARLLKPKGAISLIHRADRLDQLLSVLRKHFGKLTVYPLWPKSSRNATRVIIHGTKSSDSPTKLKPGIILHRADGSYTSRIKSALMGNSLLSDPSC
ncbi:MAG: methyltransferase [Rhodospirillaceae bacterium]|nr:methyltransferase [Rhodospirillaceae bacterium]